MGRVSWEEMYSVHIKELDEQHKKLVDYTNEIYDKLDSQSFDLAEFDGFFDKLTEFADWHFGTEEKYFAKFHYPGAAPHINEHNKIKNRIMELKAKFLGARSADTIFETLKLFDDWLFVHIMEFDKKYVKFFHEHGLNGLAKE